MNNNKFKILGILILALTVLFTLTACSSGGNKSSNVEKTTVTLEGVYSADHAEDFTVALGDEGTYTFAAADYSAADAKLEATVTVSKNQNTIELVSYPTTVDEGEYTVGEISQSKAAKVVFSAIDFNAEVNTEEEFEQALKNPAADEITITAQMISSFEFDQNVRDLTIYGQNNSLDGNLSIGDGETSIIVTVKKLEITGTLTVDVSQGDLNISRSTLNDVEINSVGSESFNMIDSSANNVNVNSTAQNASVNFFGSAVNNVRIDALNTRVGMSRGSSANNVEANQQADIIGDNAVDGVGSVNGNAADQVNQNPDETADEPDLGDNGDTEDPTGLELSVIDVFEYHFMVKVTDRSTGEALLDLSKSEFTLYKNGEEYLIENMEYENILGHPDYYTVYPTWSYSPILGYDVRVPEGNYTLNFSRDGLGSASVDFTNTIEVTVEDPYATAVIINGTAKERQTLTAGYIYNSSDAGHPEAETSPIIKWYKSDLVDGSYTEMTGDNIVEGAYTLTEADIDQYLKVGIIVQDTAGNTGSEMFSDPFGPINNFKELPEAVDLNITGTAVVGETITGSYTYVPSDYGYPEDESQYAWYHSNSSDYLGTIIDSAFGFTTADSSNISYVLQPEDIGKYIFLTITPKDDRTEGDGSGYTAASVEEEIVFGPVAAAGISEVDVSITEGSAVFSYSFYEDYDKSSEISYTEAVSTYGMSTAASTITLTNTESGETTASIDFDEAGVIGGLVTYENLAAIDTVFSEDFLSWSLPPNKVIIDTVGNYTGFPWSMTFEVGLEESDIAAFMNGLGLITTEITSKETHYNITVDSTSMIPANNPISGNTTSITDQVTVAEFMGNINFPIASSYKIANSSTITGEFANWDFDSITAKNDTDNLAEDDLLLVKAVDGTLRGYYINVVESVS